MTINVTGVDKEIRSDMLPPPIERYTVLGWIVKNLFSSWYNGILTFVAIGIIVTIGRPAIIWAFSQARWVVIPFNMANLMVGVYPRTEIWRVWCVVYLIAGLVGLTWRIQFTGHNRGVIVFVAFVMMGLFPIDLAFMGMDGETIRTTNLPRGMTGVGIGGLLGMLVGQVGRERVKRISTYGWLWFYPIAIFLIRGISSGHDILPLVKTSQWGGLMLNTIVSSTALVLGLPIGIVFALGRRSKLPVFRTVSIVFIEFIRGVPLITILFTAQVMIPLFLPEELRIDNLIRAMIGVTLFAAAYIAEIVRGGLQAIPRGQYEASDALAMTKADGLRHIILPQALRTTIPMMV
ncbi:MAG: amino acid ABC transporter permease, partial [Anaerolineales bacterium]|nr:amino acid ABC transporter permease [Anaerolineales bacterium]